MTKDQILNAVVECQRFLERANDLLGNWKEDGQSETGGWINGTRRSGAVRRASMDLTRALTDLRKGS